MVCPEHFSQHEEKQMAMVYLGSGKKEQRREKKWIAEEMYPMVFV